MMFLQCFTSDNAADKIQTKPTPGKALQLKHERRVHHFHTYIINHECIIKGASNINCTDVMHGIHTWINQNDHTDITLIMNGLIILYIFSDVDHAALISIM